MADALAGCWTVDAGTRGLEDILVEMTVILDRGAVVRDVRFTDQARFNSDPVFRTVAERARRAVLSPQCSPLPLPADKYETWRTLTLRFNARGLMR